MNKKREPRRHFIQALLLLGLFSLSCGDSTPADNLAESTHETAPTDRAEDAISPKIPSPVSYDYEEVDLGPYHENAVLWKYSDNRTHVAYVVEHDGEATVMLDGVAVASHAEVDDVALSADGSSLAYVVQEEKLQYAVVDGQAHEKYDEVSRLSFSPIGSRVSYTAKKGEKYVVIVDGDVSPEWDETGSGTSVLKPTSVGFGTVAFSDDGKHFGYAASREGKWFVVADGEIGPAFDAIKMGAISFDHRSRPSAFSLAPVLSSSGGHFAYIAQRADKWTVVVDHQPGPFYDEIQSTGKRGQPIFSGDGKRVAYEATKGDHSIVVVDGREGPKYRDIARHTTLFSPNGNKIAYVATDDVDWDSAFVVLDDKRGKEYTAIGFLIFSPDSSRLAYYAWKGDDSLVVVDGKTGAQYEGIGCLTFAPDSKHVSYCAKNNDQWFIINGDEISSSYTNVTSGTFSPDSKRFAFKAQRGDHWFVVLDGQEQEKHDRIWTVEFSPCSRHTAWVVRDGEVEFVVVDGQHDPHFDEILSAKPTFHADGSIEYLGIRSGTLIRAKHSPIY